MLEPVFGGIIFRGLHGAVGSVKIRHQISKKFNYIPFPFPLPCTSHFDSSTALQLYSVAPTAANRQCIDAVELLAGFESENLSIFR